MTMTTTTAPMPILVGRALEAICGDSLSADRYARAAAGAILLAWIQNREEAFHPHDCAYLALNHGAPPELVALIEACPELDQDWRELMAAKQLAYEIGEALEQDSGRAERGLSSIAVAAELSQGGDALAELAQIATGRA